MSFLVTDAFVQQFTGTVRMLAQQGASRLRPCVIEDSMPAEGGYMEQIAPVVARKRISRHADTPLMITQHLRRRLATYDWEWADLVDNIDRLRLIIDPTSNYANAAAMSLGRAIDDEILSAMFGVAYTGHAGGTSISWPAGNSESTPTTAGGTVVSVNSWAYGNGSGITGLTISKLIEANVGLKAAEGDENEEKYIVVTAIDEAQLLGTTEATSADYNLRPTLADGRIMRFMGFTFIHSERVQLDASNYRLLPAWRKSAMGFGVTQDISSRISERPDKSYAWQVYASMSVGAARLEEAKLAQIKCQ